LETAEHSIIDVGRLCAAELGLRCENGAYRLRTLSERQLIHLALDSDLLRGSVRGSDPSEKIGLPFKVRIPTKLGFKNPKWVTTM
jgi:hypothetical protein